MQEMFNRGYSPNKQKVAEFLNWKNDLFGNKNIQEWHEEKNK